MFVTNSASNICDDNIAINIKQESSTAKKIDIDLDKIINKRLSKRDHKNNIIFNCIKNNIPKYSESINNYKYMKKYKKYTKYKTIDLS